MLRSSEQQPLTTESLFIRSLAAPDTSVGCPTCGASLASPLSETHQAMTMYLASHDPSAATVDAFKHLTACPAQLTMNDLWMSFGLALRHVAPVLAYEEMLLGPIHEFEQRLNAGRSDRWNRMPLDIIDLLLDTERDDALVEGACFQL